jgi:zinc resistance-associated protein
MIKHSRLALVLGGVALPLMAALPAFAQQPPAPAQPPAPQAETQAARPNQLSPADRAAFLDARIAAVHAGLKLTPDQEKLWPNLEKAVRDGMTRLADLRQQRRDAQRPSDMVEAMGRRAEADLTRGTAMKAIADAARPLYATLNDDQKRRLPMLMHAGRQRMAERVHDRDHRHEHHRGMGPGRGGQDQGMGMDRDMGPGMMRRGDRDWGPGMMRRGDREDGPRSRWSDRDGPDRRN